MLYIYISISCISCPYCSRSLNVLPNYLHFHRCICEQGYTGKDCERRYYPCSPSPCENGGRCSQIGAFNYACSCPPGKNIFFVFECKTGIRQENGNVHLKYVDTIYPFQLSFIQQLILMCKLSGEQELVEKCIPLARFLTCKII